MASTKPHSIRPKTYKAKAKDSTHKAKAKAKDI